MFVDCHMTGNIKKSSVSMESSMPAKPIRLGLVEGHQDKKNEIIYHPPSCQFPSGYVIFFGGDMQDYKENMLAHRDNKHYAQWDLESTAVLLHNHFPAEGIIVVKPSKMALKTFSCYENFVEVNNFGAPTYEKNNLSIRHLELLLSNVEPQLQKLLQLNKESNAILTKPLKLIGFSKGCVVLNQLLYSFLSLQENLNERLNIFVNNISSMYWLEGGHSGISSTWVTDRTVLQNFSNFKIAVHIHVTPYQVLCDTRPRIGKEEKLFREILLKMGANVTRMLHFESESRSLEKHFQVLEVFKQGS